MKISIIFPVLNEEKRLENGIRNTAIYFGKNLTNIEYELIIADNGSTDKTEEIASKMIKMYNNIQYLKVSQKGVGLAIREGLKLSSGEIVGYMDIDLATDMKHLQEITNIFSKDSNIDAIIGNRNSKESKVEKRKVHRTIISYGLAFIINASLKTNFSDYMCGFKFFKVDVLKQLVGKCSNYKGWFYCAELIIVARWLGYNVKSIPIHWIDDPRNSKSGQAFLKIIKEYIRQITILHRKYRNNEYNH